MRIEPNDTAGDVRWGLEPLVSMLDRAARTVRQTVPGRRDVGWSPLARRGRRHRSASLARERPRRGRRLLRSQRGREAAPLAALRLVPCRRDGAELARRVFRRREELVARRLPRRRSGGARHAPFRGRAASRSPPRVRRARRCPADREDARGRADAAASRGLAARRPLSRADRVPRAHERLRREPARRTSLGRRRELARTRSTARAGARPRHARSPKRAPLPAAPATLRRMQRRPSRPPRARLAPLPCCRHRSTTSTADVASRLRCGAG